MACDAGGPGRELITVAAESIFDKATRLMTEIAKGLFVLFGSTDSKLYSAVGFLMAIVVRTALVQDFPFVPLVWKFMAGAPITRTDILEADPDLATSLKHLSSGVRWVCCQWDGEEVVLPGHDGHALVTDDKIEIYVHETIALRQRTLMPGLTAMKAGFEKNAGISVAGSLDWQVLSVLAQGTWSVSVDDQQRMTEISDLNLTSLSQERLWRVLGEFSDEQRHLFLKFVTGQARLPRSGYHGQFGIRVSHMSGGDGRLPMAATCFSSLRWSDYSSDEIAATKLDYAIRNCQTMENA
jgi:hypothetical protein